MRDIWCIHFFVFFVEKKSCDELRGNEIIVSFSSIESMQNLMWYSVHTFNPYYFIRWYHFNYSALEFDVVAKSMNSYYVITLFTYLWPNKHYCYLFVCLLREFSLIEIIWTNVNNV